MTIRYAAAAALLAAGLLSSAVAPAEARGGCGLGFHRGPYGGCRPNLGFAPRWHGPGWHRWGWHHPYGWHRYYR